jgi:hypothetical protein
MSIEKNILQKLIIGLIPVNTEKLEKIEFEKEFEQDIKDIMITNSVNIHNVNPLLFNFLEKSEVIDKWCILFLHYRLEQNSIGDLKYPFWSELSIEKELSSVDIEMYIILVLNGIYESFKDIYDFRFNIEILNYIFSLIPADLLTHRLIDIQESFWVLGNTHEVFLDIFIETVILNKNYISLKDFLKVAKKTVHFNEYKLIKNHNGDIVLYMKQKENTHITTSPVIAAHVSSGSIESYNNKSGYRHINFITVKGSLYYGSGLTNDHKTKKLLEKLLIMTSG